MPHSRELVRPRNLGASLCVALIATACWHTADPTPPDDVGLGGMAPGGIGGKAGLGGLGATAGSALGGAGVGGVSVGGKAGQAGGGSGGAPIGGMAGTVATAGAGMAGMSAAGASAAGAGGMHSRGPTPATATSKFPFPQNRHSTKCTYPYNYDNEDVKTVYAAWKNDLVTSDGAGGFRRVKRPAEPGLNVNSTVSEGIAYGMLIAVYMDDQALFDDLWRYELLHTWQYRAPGGGETVNTILMNWYILENGNTGSQNDGGTDGNGAATDADEDMAWALIMADKQWGGQGQLSKSYLDTAKQLLGDIWRFEIDNGRLPKNGSSWGGDNSLNISYFAPAYYRVFASVSGEQKWGKDVVDYVYTVIGANLNSSNGNQTNGLVPAWSQANGSPAEPAPGQNLPFHYQYDSCRTPFRIGLDACWAGDQRAVDYVSKTSSFFVPLGASKIVDGYELNGTPKAQFPDKFGGLSAAFIGPAAVGAMSSAANQSFLDESWGLLRQNNQWCGGQYYDESWTMMSMLMLTGNFLDYTQY